MEHANGAAAGPGPDAQPTPPAGPGGPAAPVTPAAPIAPGGYGYPPPQSPFPQQQPLQQQPLQQFPMQQQPPFANQGFGPAAQPFGAPSSGPDWEALAEDHQARARRRKWMWTGGIVLTACLLGGIVGTAVLWSTHGKATPSASASGTARPGPVSTVPVNTPTVPGQPNQVADHTGRADLTVSPDASVDPVQSGGFALRLRGNSNSYAQSSAQVVDVTKSFTLSAWVYNEAKDGYRTVISQGDGVSYAFDLGRDDYGGKTVWIFRVQTAAGGADATSFHAISPSVDTVGKWVLLTSSYDATQGIITLYVDGKSVALTKVPGIWAAPGALELGRNRTHSGWGGPWAGVIGHVQIWKQALTDTQIGTLKDKGTIPDAVPIASWLVG
ncbi:LamG domain-containing protein [Kitasatospora sp. MAP5-34]|uniref:LamG domain-containing protein n=1 Tax=Kitasatospora sp. MAP5-34 TaxID=3035102 RepID=UPI002474D080|nr:LamG domain-containing protein [Kitasatospora sp. MAP5-34]